MVYGFDQPNILSAPFHATGQLGYGTLLRHRYRISHRLTVTNLSAVYDSFDIVTGRTVIIKEVSYRLWRLHERRHAYLSFVREGAMLDFLSRRGFPAPERLDFFVFDGRCYLVMTKLRGNTLAELQENGGLTTIEVVRIIRQVCADMDRVHKLGFVHHDLKPENILVLANARPMIIDWGSAEKIRAAGDRRSGCMGTEEFASIEQQVGETQPDNDVFALGVTLKKLVAYPNHQLRSIIEQATAPTGQRWETANDLQQALLQYQIWSSITSLRKILRQPIVDVGVHLLIVIAVFLLLHFLVGFFGMR